MAAVVTKKGASLKKQGKQWEKPQVVDVTGKIMAQPFIRFT